MPFHESDAYHLFRTRKKGRSEYIIVRKKDGVAVSTPRPRREAQYLLNRILWGDITPKKNGPKL